MRQESGFSYHFSLITYHRLHYNCWKAETNWIRMPYRQLPAIVVTHLHVLSSRRKSMRRFLLTAAALFLLAPMAAAQTADEIVARYVKTVGGMEKIQAIKSLRRMGKFTGGG